MTELTQTEHDALRLVGVGVLQIRALARALPDSAESRKILALADGMHNIPIILAGSAAERSAQADLVECAMTELSEALRA